MNDENTARFRRPQKAVDQSPAPATSVWATGQRDLDAQLTDGGYRPASRRDADTIPPAIASYAIIAYSPPGGVVVDPDCGAGTTIVEALRAGRHAVGLTAVRRWWTLARANVTAIKATGAAFDGMVLVLDRRPATFPSAHTAGLAGRVDLILTTLRHEHAGATIADALARFRDLLDGCTPLLHPHGHLVIIARPHRRDGHLLDLPSEIRSLAEAAGFLPVERCAALTAGLRRHRLITRAALAQRRAAARHHRATGHPIALPAHHDVLVFRPAHSALAAAAQPTPTHPIRTIDVPQPRQAAEPERRSA